MEPFAKNPTPGTFPRLVICIKMKSSVDQGGLVS
jgi:hypothetical protein